MRAIDTMARALSCLLAAACLLLAALPARAESTAAEAQEAAQYYGEIG